MYRLYPALLEAASASVFLIPYLMHRRKYHIRNAQTAILILFAIYLSTVYAIAGLPTVFYIRFRPNVNLSPFLYMFSDHTTSLLNVLLFLPLGIFLPLLWIQFQNILRTLLCGFAFSAVIEFLQIFTYRVTDVNDLITNTAGTLLGFLIGMLIVKRIPKSLPNNNTDSFRTVLFVVLSTMFFIQPLFARAFFG